MDLREQALQASENRHPWELARAGLVLSLIPSDLSSKVVADVGAGDLFFSRIVQNLGPRKVYAIDPGYADGERSAGFERATTLDVMPAESLDLVFLMDVLEHVEDERTFLASVNHPTQP